MFFILCVINDPEYSEDVLSAWEKAGVTGATILHSSGLGRLRQGVLRDDLPIFPNLESLSQHVEEFSRTVFSVVLNQEVVDRVVAATQDVLGDLSHPNSGFLVVLPVIQVYGLRKSHSA